ncbi:hypothetical protein ECC02_001230 [Trypanosoma cruzi]|uniref:Uncharacterized protein n=1 Tax=Trypanosoma cruzi TaxID=5693 RepID=A0A7J6YFI6_TRYCR|nr:hypothetical protein ECC02_001230 [Trypanosoma cruzi]
MQECYNPHHRILPVGSGESAGAFVPRWTLCVTCLLNHFERLPTNAAVQALQDTEFLLQQSFSPLFPNQCVGIGGEKPSGASATPSVSPESLWESFMSFQDVLAQLAEMLCASSSLHLQTQLYRASLTLLSLFFTLLREAERQISKMNGTAYTLEGDNLGLGDRGTGKGGASISLVTLPGLARRMCDAVRMGLSKEGDSPAGLLLLTDLAEMSPTFLRVLSEYCVPSVCAILTSLSNAYRVELTLYLLHQVFEKCASHPTWLESLSVVLSGDMICDALGDSFLDFLAGILDTFRDDEPVVVNALSLARFLVTYETTRTALLFSKLNNTTRAGKGDFAPIVPLRLLRHLTLLLLDLDADIIVAASETMREIIVATQPSGGECTNIADYVIESLRTASVYSAMVLVSLLNALPTEVVPAGPVLRVIFELAGNNETAFEEAVRGPHFLASVKGHLSNINYVAQSIVHTAECGGRTSLHCFLLQIRALEAACGGINAGTCTIIPETVSVIANTLLQLVTKERGPTLTEDELTDGQWLFNNRFFTLANETLWDLIFGVAFLLPAVQGGFLPLATEIIAEALRRFSEFDLVSLDGRSLLFDGPTGNVLLVLSAAVLEHMSADGDEGNTADRLVKRQVRQLFEKDFLTFLLRVSGDSFSHRGRILYHFMRLVESNRNGRSADLPAATVLDGSSSPRALFEKSFRHHPHWAASLLLALAMAGCPQPVEVQELEEFLFKQISMLPWFLRDAKRALTADGAEDLSSTPMGNEDCAIAALAALKASAAYHKWRGELPHREFFHVDPVWATGRVCDVPEELSFIFFQLFRSEERSWLEALKSCSWGTGLLAVLVSSTIMHVKCDFPKESVKEAYDYLFSDGASQNSDVEMALCRLVVTLAPKCHLFLLQLFGIVRRSVADNLSLGCRVICFLCQCVSLAVGEEVPNSTAFIRTLLEQHVTPCLLFRENPALTGYVARLVVLTLARIPVAMASSCDHTLFRWSMQHVTHPKAQVYTWHVVFLLLERVHGNEFALRYESELEMRLRADGGEKLPPCFAAALATVKWMVCGAMRRRGACRMNPIVSMPLKEWSQNLSQHVLLRAFIISTVERETRGAFPDASLLNISPMLLSWANEMFARRYATVATARVFYTLVKNSPKLGASLEALGLFLQMTNETETGASPTAESSQLSLIEQRAWVFAALVLSWPPWGVSAGLREAVDAFLTTLEMPPRACKGEKRPREQEVDIFDTQEAGVRRAMEALVEACECRSEDHGTFPLNRPKDFFLLRHAAQPDANVTHEVMFKAVHEGCELFIPS